MRILESERLLMRTFHPDDWKDLQEYISRPEVMRFERPWDASDAACRQRVADFAAEDSYWAVELKDTGKMIGHVYFIQTPPLDFQTWTLGYIFNNAFHGHGFATEACRILLDAGFRNLGIHRVEARCCPENVPSWRLMERLGMRREGLSPRCVTFRQTAEGQPIWWDRLTYAILEEEWNL
ncbi:MAG TPA: GNAT family N-acetyltransferase [Clostridia bacterium]